MIGYIIRTIRLRKLWRQVRVDLTKAVTLLPQRPQLTQDDGSLSRFHEWLNHNELGLAFEELEALGNENAVPAAYWNCLAIAAGRMGLEEKQSRMSAQASSTPDG